MAGKKREAAAGAPAWMATFADLMTLLMCFFVLIVAFSTMDVKKYQDMAGSMKSAFGLETGVPVNAVPAGYHVVMDFMGPGQSIGQPSSKTQDPDSQKQSDEKGYNLGEPAENAQALAEDVQKLREILQEELEDGAIQVEAMDDRVVIRVDDSTAFRSGSADIASTFAKTLKQVAPLLRTMPGTVAVAGHTDDRPTRSRRFRSNWDLSTARASAVVDLFVEEGLEPSRMVAQGYAESRPLVPNDTEEGQRQNRRVEISIIRPVERMTPP